ncbi:MAG: glutathione S-transferase [Proteobacteria bacterium]|nr:glutathione S-transferase [Pseudomonadota bacterium]
MKLLFSPNSPFVRKCLVSAHELGLSARIELLPSNAHPVNRDAAIIAVNPLGKVPTFFADDGSVLYDSRVICEYLDDLAGGGRLFPPSGPARWAALRLQALADGVLEAALLARYEEVARPESLRWPEWRSAQLDKAHTTLQALERDTAALQGRVDIGTLSLACMLWYLDLRFADFGWRQRYPAVAAWAQAFGQRPSLRANWAL